MDIVRTNFKWDAKDDHFAFGPTVVLFLLDGVVVVVVYVCCATTG